MDFIYRFGRIFSLSIFTFHFLGSGQHQMAAVTPSRFFAAKKSIKNSVHTGFRLFLVSRRHKNPATPRQICRGYFLFSELVKSQISW
jgi:hypothetical protein